MDYKTVIISVLIPIIITMIANIPAFLQWRKWKSEGKAAEGDEADKKSAAGERYNTTIIDPMAERIKALEADKKEKDVIINSLRQELNSKDAIIVEQNNRITRMEDEDAKKTLRISQLEQQGIRQSNELADQAEGLRVLTAQVFELGGTPKYPASK